MQKKARIFAVMNRKGGVGKTTTAVSLAHGLARSIEGAGHVLIIDLDPQGNVATSLGLTANGKDVARVLTGEVAAEKAILHADRSKSGGPARPNLWVLPASDALADAKLTLVTNAALGSVLEQFGGQSRQVDGGRVLVQPVVADHHFAPCRRHPVVYHRFLTTATVKDGVKAERVGSPERD